ncbi:glycosyltransferase family 87 protein [Hyphococcus sp.]|jgi:hypothetical protein|uniref:glycosyltransferase family 87 protein n=1 Tax=Hyphococcus sp. TaxID=2038636 RepID=UPI003D0EAA76
MTADAAAANAPSAGFAGRYPLLHAVFIDPSPRTIVAACLIAFAIYALILIRSALGSDGYVLPDKSIIGGDFTVFWTAAKTLFAEGAGAMYQPGLLNERLDAAFPLRGGFTLYWQYPPTYYFVIAPLAALPYPAALLGWWSVTAGAAMAALRSLWKARLPLLAVFASGAAWQALICGQTGFLTAALIAIAGGWADRRPILAGIAAGLLTVKPQLGLLIPVAYAAAGCWRAFAAAAVTALALAVLSAGIFGIETWGGFIGAMSAQGARMSTNVFPYYKLVSPYGFMMTLGAGGALAYAAQGIASLALAGFVFIVWRKSPSWETRLIALAAATPLVSPYAFYYEAPIFFAALLMVVKLGTERGWLPFEKQALMALWFLPVFAPGSEAFPFPALLAFAAFGLCARRVFHECGLHLPRLKTLSEA